jgi:hypothetical protein
VRHRSGVMKKWRTPQEFRSNQIPSKKLYT